MANIDPVYLLEPVVTLAMMVGLVLYWRARRRFRGRVLLYSLVAYAGAIALKYVVQVPTISAFGAATGGSLAALGVYYGAQTAVFEVGGAYLVALYAVSRGKLGGDDSEGFGLGLAFWENAVLLAIPLLIDYAVYYAILSNPGTSAYQTLYPILAKESPGLFAAPAAALPVVGYAILERISSLLGHFAWGMLCVLAAVHRKRTYFLAALPIGFVIDFLVPFSRSMGLGIFEGGIFVFSAAALAGALVLTRRDRVRAEGAPQAVQPSNT